MILCYLTILASCDGLRFAVAAAAAASLLFTFLLSYDGKKHGKKESRIVIECLVVTLIFFAITTTILG